MYNMMDVDHPAFSICYSLVIIIIGTFFIMNLILAAIIDTFVSIQEKEEKKELCIAEIVISDDDFVDKDQYLEKVEEIVS